MPETIKQNDYSTLLIDDAPINVLALNQDGKIIFSKNNLYFINIKANQSLFDVVPKDKYPVVEHAIDNAFCLNKETQFTFNIKSKELEEFSLKAIMKPAIAEEKTAFLYLIDITREENYIDVLEKSNIELKFIEKINQAVIKQHSLNEIIDYVLNMISRFFHSKSSRFYFYDEQTNTVRIQSTLMDAELQKGLSNIAQYNINKLIPRIENNNAFEIAIRTGKIQIVSGAEDISELLKSFVLNDEMAKKIQTVIKHTNWKSFVIIPLRSNKKILGLLVQTLNYSLPPHSIASLGRLTNQVSLIISKYQAETELVKSDIQYQELFNRVPVGLYKTTIEGNIIDANSAMVEILGYPDKKTLLSISVNDLYTNPEDRVYYLNQLNEKNQIRDAELLLNKYDGSKIWIQDNATVVRDEAGKPSYYMGNLIDITQRKRAEMALMENNKKYQSLFEMAGDAIFIMKNDRFIDCNKKTLEMFRCTREQIIGHSPYEYSPTLQPDGQSSKSKALSFIRKALNGKPQNFEWLHKKHDGSTFDAEVTLNVMTLNDENFIQAIVRDISSRKDSERNLEHKHNLLKESENIASLGSFEVDLINDIVTWSEGLYNMSGYTKEELNPSLETYEMLIHPDDRKKVEKILRKALDNKSPYEVQHRYMAKNGEVQHVLVRGAFISKNKQPYRLYGTALNITKIIRSEQELLKINAELERQNKNLEQFSYILSHNLRAPVANFLGLMSLMEKSYNDTEQIKVIMQKLHKVSVNLDETIKDINLVLESRKSINDSRESVLLAEVVVQITNSIQHIIKDSNATLITDFSKLPSVHSIKSYIYNILYNLILNAIKYKQPGRDPVLKVKSWQKKSWCCFSVKDNGIGIKPELLEKIFGLYERGLSHIEGKGIGLYLVKTQIDSLGGHIRVKSREDKGSKFTVYLPLNQ
jgi:PAS domain S-box-containing protein